MREPLTRRVLKHPKGKLVVSVIFLGILVAPLLAQLILREGEIALSGKVIEKRRSDFSFTSLMSGEFQSSLEKWLRRRSTLRPILVKTDNQINLSLFQQLSGNYGSKVILGNHGQLIERTYLRSANKIRTTTPKKIVKKVEQLVRLKKLLNQNGVELLLLISPNKPSLYPDFIPSGYKVAGIEERISSYQRFIKEIEQTDLPLLDGHAYFEKLKAESSFEYFAATGTHWNEYGACLITARLLEMLAETIKQPVSQLRCEPATLKKFPGAADRDLLDLANVWFPDRLVQPVPIPQDRVVSQAREETATILIEGTSFMWTILRLLDKHRLFQQIDFYYYFKRKIRYPGRKSSVLNLSAEELRMELLRQDAVVLEINEAFPKYTGHGLLPAAIKALSL